MAICHSRSTRPFFFFCPLNWTRINYPGNFFGTHHKNNKHNNFAHVDVFRITNWIEDYNVILGVGNEKKTGKFIKWNIIANRFVVSYFSFSFLMPFFSLHYVEALDAFFVKSILTKKEKMSLGMIQMSFRYSHLWIWILVT